MIECAPASQVGRGTAPMTPTCRPLFTRESRERCLLVEVMELQHDRYAQARLPRHGKQSSLRPGLSRRLYSSERLSGRSRTAADVQPVKSGSSQ